MALVLEFKSSIFSVDPAGSGLKELVLRVQTRVNVVFKSLLGQLHHLWLATLGTLVVEVSEGKHQSFRMNFAALDLL